MRVVFGVDLTYFYWSCVSGVLLAFLYDILRIKRKLVKTPDIIVNIEDILYLIFLGVTVIYTAYEKNNGNLRLYGIVITVLVSLVYRLVLGNRAVRFFSFIIQALFTFVKKILQVITAPFRILYKKLIKPSFQNISKRRTERRRIKKPKVTPKNASDKPSGR